MRQLSTAERATLCTADYQIYGRLLIEGTPVEDIVGVNPLRQATTLADLDELVTSGTFSAKLLAGGQSLSPYLSTGAKLGGQPLFAEERAIAWQVATVAPGVTPTVAHWRKVFEGSIDTVDVDPQASRVTLKCRDKIARLLVTEIENITNNADGVPMWGFPVTGDAIFVMLESVLDQAWQYAYGSAYPDPFVLLDIPGTTGSSYWQDRTNILQALRDLGVGKNGFDLRGRWDVPGHGQDSFVLAYYNPPRPADAPDGFVFFPAVPIEDLKRSHDGVNFRYLRLTKLNRSVLGVRNVAEITPADTARVPVVTENATSIGRYARRFMAASEDAASHIDTAGEATTLGQLIVADNGFPKTAIDLELPFNWAFELNDLFRVGPDGFCYDASETVYGISRIELRYANGKGSTLLTGKEGGGAAASAEWRKKDVQIRPKKVYVSDTEPVGPGLKGAIWAQKLTA